MKKWGGVYFWRNGMTPAQKEIFLVIDEWWRKYGFGPTIDDVLLVTGEKSRGNVSRKMWKLVELGLCHGVRRRPRSIRPKGLRVRNIE
jgi:SOS-response transcriptional repressor LexA